MGYRLASVVSFQIHIRLKSRVLRWHFTEFGI